jgi:predicted nucleotidyltransferase component of viral defense system
MIGRAEIEAMAERMDVPPAYVQRDYVRGWLLSVLYSSSPLARWLVLKGGNCLRKGFFENGRHSKDLDFSCPTAIDNRRLAQELNGICAQVEARAGVHFDLSQTQTKHKFDLDDVRSVSEARIYFQDFYGERHEVLLKVMMDVTQYDRLYLQPDSRPLIHPYSDAAACAATIRCMRLEEMLARKMRCLLQRNKVIDLFDLVYGVLAGSALKVNLRLLLDAFFNITVFGRSPRVAKGLFLDLPFPTWGGYWDKYVECPKASRLAFDDAKGSFLSLVEQLLPGVPERSRSSIFFASDLRGPIMRAADSMTLIRIKYDGFVREAEPYQLAFKIRKDRVGREYLYLYDRTGGRRHGRGLKLSLIHSDAADD